MTESKDDLDFYVEMFGTPLLSRRAKLTKKWRKGLMKKLNESYDMSGYQLFLGDDLERGDDIYNMKPLYDAISKYVKVFSSHFIQEDKLEYYNFHIIKWWAIMMQNGGLIHPHKHIDGHLSGVYYLEIPEGEDDDKGAFVTLDGTGGTTTPWSLPFYSDHFKGPYRYKIPPTTDQMMIFPSSQTHCVTPYESDKMRYSISFDIMITRNNVSDPHCNGGFENTVTEPQYWRTLT